MLATLTSLRIKNLALVEELDWQLAPGFVAVTGETGAGKSVIIGALKLLLGERAEKSLIRTGADSCTVEAVFDVPAPAKLDALLDENGFEPCADKQLLLRCAFTAAGGNRQLVHGSPTTLAWKPARAGSCSSSAPSLWEAATGSSSTAPQRPWPC